MNVVDSIMVLMMNYLFTISIPYIDYKSRRREEHDYALNVSKEEENLVIKGLLKIIN